MTTLTRTAPLSKETFDLIATGRVSDEELHEFFRSHPEEPLVDAWLLRSLEPLTAQGQLRLRIARKAFSYWSDVAGRQHLFFAAPMSITQPGKPNAWERLKPEYEAGLAYALGALEAEVRLCAHPHPTEMLHLIGPSRLGACGELLLMQRDPEEAPQLRDGVVAGPALWCGLVSVPQVHAAELESLLFTVNARLSAAVNTLDLRLEALGETEGAKFRLFPPAPFWNSLSLSRLLDARLRLQPLRKYPGEYVATRQGQQVVVVGKRGQQVLRFSFPEELDSDIAPLFKGWAEFFGAADVGDTPAAQM